MLYAVINAGRMCDLRCLDLYEDLELSVIELLTVRAMNVERKAIVSIMGWNNRRS